MQNEQKPDISAILKLRVKYQLPTLPKKEITMQNSDFE